MLVYDFEDCCYFIWATVSWKLRVSPRVPKALKKSSLKIRNNRTKKPNVPLFFTSKCISFASFVIYYLSSHFDISCLKLFLKWTLRHPTQAFADKIFETLTKKNRNDFVREPVIGFYRTYRVCTVRCHVLALTRDYPSIELVLLFRSTSYQTIL